MVLFAELMAPLGYFFCLSLSLASLHHIAVCPQMAVLPVYLFEFWNKSFKKLKVSPVSEGPECRSHLRWLRDRLLWRWNTKCPNVEDFLWRCSNQRAESFSYALGRETLTCEPLNRGTWRDNWASHLMVTSSTNPQPHPFAAEMSEANLPTVLLPPLWTPQL